MGIDLAMPTTDSPLTAFQPNKHNIKAGLVVLLNGYDIMTSILGLLQAMQYARDDETMDPASSLYYTGAYRWSLRTMDLLPHWLRGNFGDALGVWNNRFKYMETDVPEWMKKLLPWVTKESWDREYSEAVKFKKFAESSFTQFYRFPSKTFNNFNSFLPTSLEDFVFSSASRDLSTLSEESEASKLARQEELQRILQAIRTTTTAAGL
ncbi:uncharacterized protein LOC133516295 isoform X2 [Cydia pomonella]|nr:uncharacterized protein LOC133516295 isoform X2 [Cydia pomonella]